MADYELTQPKVYLRSNWSDDWTLTPYLWCDRLSLNVSPGIDSAQLRWDYGNILQHDAAYYSIFYRQDIRGKYVKVEWDEDANNTKRNWYGVIAHETDVEEGTGEADLGTGFGSTLETGMQSFVAMGMEWLLSRNQISQSIVEKSDGGQQTINRVLDFNAGSSTGYRLEFAPNKKKDGPDDIFANDLIDAVPWDALQICTYLLENFGPKDSNGNRKLMYTVPLFQALDLQKLILAVPANRRTVKQILDALISPYRGMGYTVEVTITDAIALNVFSYVREDIDLPGGGKLTANQNQRSITDLHTNLLVAAPTIAYDGASKFDQVIVRGEQATITGTWEYQNGIDRQWTSSDETAYTTAASGETGYSGKTLDQQQQWDVIVRSTDILRPVFRYLEVPADWNGELQTNSIDPDDNKFWVPGLRFLHHTLMKEYHDYSGSHIEDGDTDDNVYPRVTQDYRAPFGVIADVETRHCYLHELSEQGDFDDTAQTDGRTWRAVVRPQGDFPGLSIDVIGAPQHVFAADDFTAGHAADEQSDFQIDLSWKDAQFTASMLMDYYCEAKYPETITETKDYITEKVINVPDMRLDYMVPDTVVDIDNDGTLKLSEGGYIQDDRDKLKDIAKLAYQWYKDDRKAVRFGIRTTRHDYEPGQLIREIATGDTTKSLNTVITEVDIDFRSGTSSISTGFAQLDFGAFGR